jgi:hypothetical protein
MLQATAGIKKSLLASPRKAAATHGSGAATAAGAEQGQGQRGQQQSLDFSTGEIKDALVSG